MMTSLFRRMLSTACEVSASSPSARRACKLYDVGHVPYMAAWGLQKAYVEARLSGDPAQDHGDALVLVEHQPIFTLGRGGSLEHLKFIPNEEGTLPVVRVDRGGEVTYHGPGQIVGYPLISLLNFKKDIRWFVCRVEDVIIGTLKHYGFQGVRVPVSCSPAWCVCRWILSCTHSLADFPHL